MAKFPFSVDYKRLFFYGVGGVSMSALAEYFLKQNFEVFGFDKVKSPKIDSLIGLGLKFITPDQLKDKGIIIVYTSAVEDNPDFILLKESGFKVIKRSTLLALVQSAYRKNIAVSGSHGKTTTTSMLAHVLKCANLHPTAFIGGEDYSFSNLLIGKRKVAVVEACEYKGNFLDLIGDIKIVLNIDDDHLDSYGSLENLKSAFNDFVKPSTAVVNSDDINSQNIRGKKTITFGIKNPADYTAKDIELSDKTTFTVCYKGKPKTKITLNVKGVHFVYNALSVVASARVLGVSFKWIKKGLEKFLGVKRRNERVGSFLSTDVFCDYAHHPTEIDATLSSIDLNTTAVVFQPHTYSRTRLLKDKFISVLSKVNTLIVYKTYPAREKYDKRGSARTLYLSLISKTKNKVYYADSTADLEKIIKGFTRIKTLLFVGAGDIYEIAINLTDKK